MVLEKTLESLLDSKEIKLVNPKRNQCRIFIGRTDAEPEAPIIWQPDEKSRLIGKDPDAAFPPYLKALGAPVSPLLWQVVLIMSTRHTSAITIRELCKNKFYY